MIPPTPPTCQVTRLTDLKSPDDVAVSAAAQAACEVVSGWCTDLHVVFCDDEEISGVHGEFFDDPTPTDVITFPIEGSGTREDPCSGELLVSVETAAAVAADLGHSAEHEALLYVIHGVLHLCGLRDSTASERSEMRAAEQNALQKLGVSLQYFE